MIPLPLTHTDAAGRVWRPYSVDFDSPDGAYSVYLYAISWEHARLQLEALRETGRVTWEVCGVVE